MNNETKVLNYILESEPMVCSDIYAAIKKPQNGNGLATVTKTKQKTQKPALYKVLLLNDDYTPMEFVVYVLELYFNKSLEEATKIMLNVHQSGVGVCGIFTLEVAETKVYQVLELARINEHPLQCRMEKD